MCRYRSTHSRGDAGELRTDEGSICAATRARSAAPPLLGRTVATARRNLDSTAVFGEVGLVGTVDRISRRRVPTARGRYSGRTPGGGRPSPRFRAARIDDEQFAALRRNSRSRRTGSGMSLLGRCDTTGGLLPTSTSRSERSVIPHRVKPDNHRSLGDQRLAWRVDGGAVYFCVEPITRRKRSAARPRWCRMPTLARYIATASGPLSFDDRTQCGRHIAHCFGHV